MFVRTGAYKGQRIYTINAQNAATALPALPIGGTVGQEVRAAVQAGKEVTIHESPITAHGWTGYGYTITDPDTGAGAYLIEGRGNGSIFLSFIIGIILGIAAIVASPVVLGIAGLAAMITGVLLALDLNKTDIISLLFARFIGILAGIILAIFVGAMLFFLFLQHSYF